MADLTVLEVVKDGLGATYSAASSTGDRWRNSGRQLVHVKNQSAAAVTVTIPTQIACNFGSTGTQHDISVSVGSSSEKFVGPARPEQYNVAGLATINYSAVASVTVAVLGFTPAASA